MRKTGKAIIFRLKGLLLYLNNRELLTVMTLGMNTKSQSLVISGINK